MAAILCAEGGVTSQLRGTAVWLTFSERPLSTSSNPRVAPPYVTCIGDQEFSDELTGLMPCMLHGITGANCTGRVVAVVEDPIVELRCDKCGAVVGVVQAGIMEGLLGLDSAEARCPHCGTVNTFATIEQLLTYVCEHCGQSVNGEDSDTE
jgi:hypothetical protein